MISRCLLNPDKPLLNTAALRLLSLAKGALPLDLSDTLVLVPTAQAGRRLREELAAEAGKQGVLSPVVMTPPALWQAGLTEQVAGELECLFAWREVLGGQQARRLLGLPELSSRSETGQIRQLAQQLQSLRFELAQGRQKTGEVLDFALVDQALRELGEEDARWAELAELEQEFRAQLQTWERIDPVLAQPQWPVNLKRIKRIIFLGLADPMPRLLPWLSSQLAQRAELGESISLETWVATADGENLDAWGRPLASAWAEAAVELGEARLLSCTNAKQLAQQVVEQVATWEISSDALSLGLCEPSLSQSLRSEFEAAGWACFDPQSQQAASSSILPVLELLRDLLQGQMRAVLELGAFVKLEPLLPALGGASVENMSWLVHCWAEVLPTREEGLRHLVSQLEYLALHGRGSKAQVKWVRELLTQTLAWRESFSAQRVASRSLRELGESLANLDDGAAGAWWRQWDLRVEELANLETQGVSLEPSEALDFVLQSLPSVPSLREGEEIALEFEGWLELGFATQEYLVICGLHEQVVPAKPSDGAFLHDGLREMLGLRGRAWRFAVDALRLSQILASRDTRKVLVTCVAQLPGGETRLPSRLLLRPSARENRETGALAGRALQLFSPAGEEGFQALPAWNRGELVLHLDELEAKAHSLPWRRGLSASKLRDYLHCPLRFALKHIWGMERLEWEEHEMNARQSGNLVHAVVEDFACQEGVRDSVAEGEIIEFLRERLSTHARLRYGKSPALPLKLQLHSLERRLIAFARWQVAWREQGWQIIEAEHHLGQEAGSWQIGGVDFEGFIDRIDQHEDGRWMIWDYKTRARAKGKGGLPSEREEAVGELAESIHWRNSMLGQGEEPLAELLEVAGKRTSQFKRWVDLQLPLYALAWQRLQQLEGRRKVSIGQIVLGAKEQEVGGYLWPAWTQIEGIEQSAQVWAKAAVERICAGQFWPPSEQVNSWDEYALLAPDGWERALSRESLELLGWQKSQSRSAIK